jgi:hypothetical protein
LATKTNILVARVSYYTTIDGKRFLVHRGKTTAHANHPIVRGNEDKWRSLTVDYAVDGEPDEKPEPPKKRSPGRPKKQAETPPVETRVEQPALDEVDKEGE